MIGRISAYLNPCIWSVALLLILVSCGGFGDSAEVKSELPTRDTTGLDLPPEARIPGSWKITQVKYIPDSLRYPEEKRPLLKDLLTKRNSRIDRMRQSLTWVFKADQTFIGVQDQDSVPGKWKLINDGKQLVTYPALGDSSILEVGYLSGREMDLSQNQDTALIEMKLEKVSTRTHPNQKRER